ncbi:uncharacterized protein CIMG_06806 [Coccidioides immitis RS]|uniref:Uncharacterized protein n=1 Tax=Coccidioides immitis (strain RS) TaxID=246410 RepID=A0A0E1RWX8_COCIM|nr:uncharacterized protein CIMG_06806 [Coccidioides immitis RS]EAS31327.2 hypothetical protein CIMG_06806 [Coccidioides immitis RS]
MCCTLSSPERESSHIFTKARREHLVGPEPLRQELAFAIGTNKGENMGRASLKTMLKTNSSSPDVFMTVKPVPHLRNIREVHGEYSDGLLHSLAADFCTAEGGVREPPASSPTSLPMGQRHCEEDDINNAADGCEGGLLTAKAVSSWFGNGGWPRHILPRPAKARDIYKLTQAVSNWQSSLLSTLPKHRITAYYPHTSSKVPRQGFAWSRLGRWHGWCCCCCSWCHILRNSPSSPLPAAFPLGSLLSSWKHTVEPRLAPLSATFYNSIKSKGLSIGVTLSLAIRAPDRLFPCRLVDGNFQPRTGSRLIEPNNQDSRTIESRQLSDQRYTKSLPSCIKWPMNHQLPDTRKSAGPNCSIKSVNLNLDPDYHTSSNSSCVPAPCVPLPLLRFCSTCPILIQIKKINKEK